MSLFNQDSLMAKLFCPRVEKYQINNKQESRLNLGTFLENFKANTQQFIMEESKQESLIWDVQVTKNQGFYPIKLSFTDALVKPEQWKSTNKENSGNYVTHNLVSVVSLQQLPTHYEQKLNPKSEILKKKLNLQVKTSACKCKKTRCLKLYCECFADGKVCG